MALIVVEGVDGSGKTTLVNELSDVLGDSARVLHRGPLKMHPLVEYEHDLLPYIPGSGEHVICDRWHLGEMIYGPLYRGENRVTPAMKRHIELFLDSRGAERIIVDVPLDVVKYRLATRGEDFLQKNHVAMVHDWYNSYSHDGWRPIDPENEDGSILDRVHILIEDAEDNEAHATEVHRFKTYVGPPTVPNVLILGLHRGANVAGRPHFPSAFVPYSGTSGHYLLSALEAVEFNQMFSFGLANAAEEPDLYGLWETLGRPNVVALGNDVRTRVNNAIPQATTVTVPHPSQIRRTDPHDVTLYGRAIATACKKMAGIPE